MSATHIRVTPHQEPASTALIVDDDRLILATLSHGLRDGGLMTVEASNGAEALQACAQNSPDIAIIDYDLPDITGLEVAKALQQPQATFPIIFLSAYGDGRIVDAAVEMGAMSYLVKPVDPTKLVPAIRVAIQRFAELKALRGESAQLSMALKTTRATSIVVGLLMERLRLSEVQAYERLRQYSRSQNRKVADVAADILGAAESLNSTLTSISSMPMAGMKRP